MQQLFGSALLVLVFASTASPQGPDRVRTPRETQELPGLTEIPGEREFTSRLIVRPIQIRSMIAAGESPAEALRRHEDARRTLSAWTTVRYVPQTDETILQLRPAEREADAIAAILGTGLFEYAEPDWLVYPPKPVDPKSAAARRGSGSTSPPTHSFQWLCPDDPRLDQQWHHNRARLGSCEAWFQHTGTPTISIGICDTGLRTTHEDLQRFRLEGYNAVDRLWESQGGDISPVLGHGTSTTGVAAANGNNGVGIAGVGWYLGHRMLRVSNESNGAASLSDLQHAVRTSIENGDRVASVSYSGVEFASNLTTSAYVHSLGGLLVWAAGNAGTTFSSPDRDADDLIVVGATDSADVLAGFSNRGAFVDLVAPGVSVYTLSASSDSSYGGASGTSFACPMAAGVCAMIWSQQPNLSPGDVEYILKSSAHDLGAPGVDDLYGYGRIDLAAALAMDATRPLQAEIGVAPPSGLSPLTVSFHDLSTGVATSWIWDFGDGAVSTEQNPTHTYVNSGMYTVTLTATNALGSDTTTVIDAVAVDFAPPIASFWANPSFGTGPLAVQ
ncbi:MAG TPA: PKD domain-containing protein, partial [Planctomycetes bacterium]|nr:PKD domain-containing protein [Planctomycetota bacterium]